MTDNERNLIIRGIALLTVLFFTIGIFLSFAPDLPRYSYWISMFDVSLMVLATGLYTIYNFQLMKKNTTSKLPVAMHISIGSTISIFLIASVAISILFILFFNYSGFDQIYLWVVLSKWLLLILVIIAMWSIGMEGKGIIHGRSREDQIILLNMVQLGLKELHQLPNWNESGALQRKIDDDLTLIRNQIRSRVSAKQMADDEFEQIHNLLLEVRRAISEVRDSSESDREVALLHVQNSIQKISQVM